MGSCTHTWLCLEMPAKQQILEHDPATCHQCIFACYDRSTLSVMLSLLTLAWSALASHPKLRPQNLQLRIE